MGQYPIPPPLPAPSRPLAPPLVRRDPDAARELSAFARLPEYKSLAAFQAAKEEELDFDVRPFEVDALAFVLHLSSNKVVAALRAAGYSFAERARATSARGFNSRDNTRWDECK